jgi:hypothetical protein
VGAVVAVTQVAATGKVVEAEETVVVGAMETVEGPLVAVTVAVVMAAVMAVVGEVWKAALADSAMKQHTE